MKIISHRGYWKALDERNSIEAFKRSFDLGFGTETDVRDCAGELVISHDMPTGTELRVSDFLDIYCSSGCKEPLALNIKSDGLQESLKILLEDFKVNNYFLFDMSVPDAVVSLRNELICYTRQSEYEQPCSFYEQASGVWMDEFHSDWIDFCQVQEHLKNGKKVCIVSPELHGRDPKEKWLQYIEFNKFTGSEDIILCTDLPEIAKEFINNAED
jgi:hypothetical protein